MRWLVIYMLTACLPVYADVFKCVESNREIKYQDEACSQHDKQAVLPISPTPQDQIERAIEQRHLVEEEYTNMLSNEAKQTVVEMENKKKQLEILNQQARLQNQQLQNYNLQHNSQQKNYQNSPIIIYPYSGGHNPQPNGESNKNSTTDNHPLLHPQYHGINLGLPAIN